MLRRGRAWEAIAASAACQRAAVAVTVRACEPRRRVTLGIVNITLMRRMEEGRWFLTSALCGPIPPSVRPSETGAGCGCNNNGRRRSKSSMAGGCGEWIRWKRPWVGEHEPRPRRRLIERPARAERGREPGASSSSSSSFVSPSPRASRCCGSVT